MSYKKIKTLFAALTACALLTCSLSGCGDTAKGAPNPSDADTFAEQSPLEEKDMFTDRDKEVGYDENLCATITLADGASSCTDSSVTISGDCITLSQEGTYLVSGALSNGQIIVDTDKNTKVQLVLDGVDISCATSSPLYVRTADKVFITLADGTANKLSTTSEFIAIDDNNIDAAIFSKADLTLNGSGTLTVSCADGHGIVSKDDLVITGGTYDITAAKHALSGKDSVRIADGTLNLTAGKDGIHSENTDDMDKGFIYIAGGSIHITCESDGLDGDNTVQIDGGSLEIAAGDDGIHSDSDLIITDGKISVTKSYEGLEGMTITISGGEIRVVSSDDGLNAAGAGKNSGTDDSQQTDMNPGGQMQLPSDADSFHGRGGFEDRGNFGDREDFGNREDFGDRGNFGDREDFEGRGNFGDREDFGGRGGFGGGKFGGGFGGGFDEGTDYNKITISGGTLYVDAGGDGLDSNGDLIISGGEIFVYGPTNNGDGALDYAGTGTITGGTVIAVGASGMAMNFGSDSTQGSMLVTVGNSLITGAVTLTDADGRTIVSCTPNKGYNSVVISSPLLAVGQTYTLTAGDTSTTVTMESLICSNASGGNMGGFIKRPSL